MTNIVTIPEYIPEFKAAYSQSGFATHLGFKYKGKEYVFERDSHILGLDACSIEEKSFGREIIIPRRALIIKPNSIKKMKRNGSGYTKDQKDSFENGITTMVVTDISLLVDLSIEFSKKRLEHFFYYNPPRELRNARTSA
jgi:hypothetical protein